MKKQFLCLIVFCLNCAFVVGQNKESLLQKANVLFEAGDYKQAKNYFEAYRDVKGSKDVSKRIADAEKCSEMLISANAFFKAKDYINAAKNYFDILALNPKDKNAKSRQNEIKKTAGVEYYNNGYYVGAFDFNGKRHGQGVYRWNDGVTYKGQWTSGERAGSGAYYFADGTTETGNYVHGKWIADTQKTQNEKKNSLETSNHENKRRIAGTQKTQNKENNFFVALGYMFSPTAYLGFLAGGCGNRWGGYGSVKTHLLNNNHNVLNVENLDVNFDKYKHFRWSISGGGMYRPFKQCYVYAGLGYGEYGKAYQLNNHYNKEDYHLPEKNAGLDIECGLIYAFRNEKGNGWYISAGYNTLTLVPKQVHDFSVGIGIAF
ncbi:MAG: hypothetical protein LBC98_04245 [Prevotellaceae bacterium]|jgi:hypothetical protein|nr:hypothetical protein [Prevotellaceae bacterium]